MPVRIASKQEGFRRCGVAHTSKPVIWPDDRFTARQIKELQSEPMLIVDIVSDTAHEPASVSQVMTLGELIASADHATLQLARGAINDRLIEGSDVPGLLALREEINDALDALGYTDPLLVVPVDENTTHAHAGSVAGDAAAPDGTGATGDDASQTGADNTAPDSAVKPDVKDAKAAAKSDKNSGK